MNKKFIGTLAAAALLVSLAPVGASAAVTADAAPAVKKEEKAHAQDRILVKFKAGKDSKAVSKKLGAEEAKSLGNGKSEWKLVKVPNGKAAEMLEKFNADADVELAEPDYIHTVQLTPNDPSYGSQWHHPNIQANLAWDITRGTSARTIAIIDTGVDIQHGDLSSKIVAGYDFVNNDTNADDDQGHGTHCAGIAAAIGMNSYQGTGVDMNARIMPVKVLNSQGSGYTSDIIDGVYYAADNGAHVLSMSLGGGGATSAFQSAIDYAHSRGKIVVAAAGNSNTSAKSYPAAYNNVIAVASTTSSNTRSSFSNYGTWVDIAAPGSSIYATANGGGMTTMSGTSMATPVVAGVLSLAWSKNTGYSNTTVINRVLSTADAISGTGTYWMNGKVNAYKAVNGF
ncbi:S8 family serine peptidase [Tumebacillus sp. DT12]|uniref:S8 family serine peptidase n=1 Tax=Tumebacillus lacus TaxID=2995335 RepID=A0ABT3X2W2_9BACL|nr:S8 family serine peptidase [Tumebacillus lacus]MCX7571247.1 S8 family serine peptidase [Tumebacillus lacus]